MYALVDCNSFYASCEAVFRPDLIGQPVVVLSNNDGCVVARNAAAKAGGVPDLVPFFQARPVIERIGAKVFSSNYELYGDMSRRVMSLLGDLAGDIEVYSIDEAFLRLLSTDRDYRGFGGTVRDRVAQDIGLPVCVGLAPTKTLAKLANRAAKKISKLAGVCVLDEPAKWEWLLARIGTQEIWGIGSRLRERLSSMGVDTALQLAQADPKWLRKQFSVVVERTARELNGEPCMALDQEPAPRKEIICTRSFAYKITELAELQQAASQYAARAAEKLRAQDSVTSTLWVYLESFDPAVGYYNRQNVAKLPHPTNDTREISVLAAESIAPLFRAGIKYKKCGVGLLDVRPRNPDQIDLFRPGQSDQSRSLMTAMDSINRRYGRGTVALANQGINPAWRMTRGLKSPSYTTQWHDLPRIKC